MRTGRNESCCPLARQDRQASTWTERLTGRKTGRQKVYLWQTHLVGHVVLALKLFGGLKPAALIIFYPTHFAHGSGSLFPCL